MSNSWRQRATSVIMREINAGLAANKEPSAIRRLVDAAYPFGERAMHPYKIWLSERLKLFVLHGLGTTEETKRLLSRHEKTVPLSRGEIAKAERDFREAKEDGLFK